MKKRKPKKEKCTRCNGSGFEPYVGGDNDTTPCDCREVKEKPQPCGSWDSNCGCWVCLRYYEGSS